MNHQQKQNLVSLITSIVVSVPYLFFIYTKYKTEQPTSANELAFWATAILLLIPLRIVVEIIVSIIATIITTIATRKDEVTTTDERDRLINLKAMRNGYCSFVLGFVLSMIVAVTSQSITSMFVIIIVNGIVGELVSIGSKIYYYQKGF